MHFLLEPATFEDCWHIFDWRNDEATRAASKSLAPLDPTSHEKWFVTRMNMPCPNLFIAKLNGVPVGSVRIDDGTLSYMVAPAFRRRGVAKAMLAAIRVQFGSLKAEIKSGNIASEKAARAAGHHVLILEDA